jgi:transcriptional regulator with XRE-family HTH domain|nr:helix-turn-helix transcriptional regulator [uncultured Dialister sp.]
MPEYSFEQTDFSFSRKFKALRTFYQISYRDLGTMMNYKSKANLTNFEKFPMTTKPSYQTIAALPQIFGISIDWMLGYSKIPYTEETIKQAENEQANRFLLDLPVGNSPYDSPESLTDFLKREMFPNSVISQELSLSDRFILLFLLNYLALYFVQYYIAHHDSKIQMKIHKFKEFFEGSSTLEPDSITRHPDYMPAILKLYGAVKQSKDQSSITPRSSILDNRWDFIDYLQQASIF